MAKVISFISDSVYSCIKQANYIYRKLLKLAPINQKVIVKILSGVIQAVSIFSSNSG